MNNKQKKNNRKVPKAKARAQSVKRPTPFSDAGAIAGSKLGTMLNLPYLKGVGKWLGSGIGQIFGSGDYTILGAPPKYNVLMNGSQIPQFREGNGFNVISRREYLGDVSGTTAFTNNSFPLNPGISSTFPWLSTIAQNYQQYRFHGIIFEFRPLITDFVTAGAPGVVVLATNYNADQAPYTTKQEMENSEFAVSVKPTLPLMHGVECATLQTVLNQMYVRTGTLPASNDLKFTDLGLMQVGTQSNPSGVSLGELWVSYCVEFFKPILPSDVGGAVSSGQVDRSTVTAATNPFGAATKSSKSTIGLAVSGTTISFLAQPGNFYGVTICWSGTIATAASVHPVISATANCSFVGYYDGGATSFVAPSSAITTGMTFDAVLNCTSTGPSTIILTAGLAGVLPTGTTSCQVIVRPVATASV